MGDIEERRERRRASALRYSDWILREDYLPRMVGTSIGLAVSSGACLSRQPTLARALAVVDRVRERLEDRGLRARIRIGRRTGTFGVYLIRATAYQETGGAA